MGKSSGAKQQVDLYYMSIHFGVCIAADAMKRIIIKEKEAWTGYVSAKTAITINKPDLFGGVKKEGGAQGVVHWLPGADTQVLPDALATRLGRSGGDDAPGYRGIASAWFVGSSGGGGSGFFSGIFGGGVTSTSGFYWTANTPYLPGTWITVERAPKGLNPDYRMIPRPSSAATHPYEQPSSSVSPSLVYSTPAGGVIAISNEQTVEWFDLASKQSIGFATASDSLTGFITNWALADDGTAYAIGQYVVGVSVFSALYVVPVAGPYEKVASDAASFVGPTRVFETEDGRRVLTAVTPGLTGFIDMGMTTAGAETSRDFCQDGNGDVWMLTQPDSSSADFTLSRMTVTALALVVTGLVTRSGPSIATFCHVPDFAHFFVVSDGKWYAIDDTLGTIKGSGSFSLSTLNLPRNNPGQITYWAEFAEVSLEDASTVRTVNPSDWVAEATVGEELYDPVNHAIWSSQFGHQTVRLLDRGELDANPAHIIYECLTDTDWGMGSPSTLIDVDSFEDAGVALYNEPLGLSLLWTKQAAIQDFVQENLNHINGVVYVDPQTGLITLKLIRGDYDPDDLPTIDPSTALLTNFGRKLWGDIVNEINVTWTNPDNEQDETVTVQDLASIATQGGIVSDSRNYYGVRYALLAKALATRELRSAGAPLATFQAEVDRSFYFLRPASVLKVDWPEYGLSEIVARVTSIDYGKPGDPSIKLSLIEDVFGLDVGDYEDPPASAWEDPSQQPSAMDEQAVLTMPYLFAANSTAPIADAHYPDVLAGVLAATDNADAYSYELWGEVTLSDGSTEWQNLATNNLLAFGELVSGLDAEAESTGVTFDSFVGTASPSVPGFAIIGTGDETENEIAHLTGVSGGAYTLERGVLDTVPRAWAAATPVWFIGEDSLIEDPTTRSAGEIVSYRLRTRTSQGLLAYYLAPLLTYTLTERPWLPSRPADVKAYGVAFSSASDTIDAIARPDPWVTVDWANRNRLTEDSQVLAWDDATTTPETDQTTTILVLAPDETLLATHDGLTGTTFDVPDADFGSLPIVILRTSSERIDADGTFESLQFFDHWVTVGFAGGAEADAGVGAFSGAGAIIVAASLSAGGTGAMSATGLANSAGSFSGSGAGDFAVVSDDTAFARRYTRIRITAPIHPSAAVYAISELTCHETVGGADVLAGSGATITATSTTGTNTTAKLVDADTTTFWASTATGTQDLVIDWGAGAGKDICEIGLRGRNDSSWQQSPGTVAVAYSSDNSTYTTDWSIPFITMQLDLGGLPFPLQKFRRTSLFPATSPNHRIWGVRWNACQSGTLPEINKIEMHATVGGSTINTGGTPLACIFFNTSNFPSWAFTGTDFAMVDLSHGVIAYDFGEGNEQAKPAEITLKASSIPNRAPTDFDLIYMDGLGGTVNVQQNFTSPATWTGGLTRTFTVT